MMRTIRFFTFILIVICFSIVIAAQATTGTVVVTVRDQTGARIPGATVTFRPVKMAAGGEISRMTDGDGIAEFVQIAPGLYQMQSAATNFNKSFLKEITLYTGRKQDIEVFLDVGPSTDDTFTVPGPAAQPVTVISAEGAKQPPSSPNFRSLLDIAPFVRDEQLTGGVSIDGATGPDNTYFIDGQEVTNPTTGAFNRNYNLPFTLLQEVGVRSGAERAEFGGSIGGVVNIVTQGGNDRWRGDVGFSFVPAGLNGSARPVINRFGTGNGQFEFFNPNKDDSNAYFPYGSVGGPVVKEKLWFFAAYSPQFFQNKRKIDYYDTSAPTRVVTQTIEYKEDIRQEFAFVRLDTQPFKTVKGTISYLWNPTVQDGRLPPVDEGLFGLPQFANGLTGAGLLATQGGRNNSNVVNGNFSWSPTSQLFLNIRAGRGFLNEKLDTYGNSERTRYLCSVSGTPQNVPGSNCSPGFNTGPNFADRLDANTRTSAAVEGGFIGLNAGGLHTIKFGYQYDRIQRDVDNGYVDTGYIVLYYGLPITSLGIPVTPTGPQCDYTMNPNPTNCWVGSGLMQRFGVLADTWGENQALYGQDTWQIGDRLTINAGVRFENEIVPEYGEIESLRFSWKDKISPRFGAAVDLFGNGKTRVFGSYFWNYDRLKANVIESNGGDIFVRDYFEILPERGVSYTDYTYNNILGGQTDPFDFQCPFFNGPGYSVCRFGFFFSNIGPFPPILPLVDPDMKPTRQEVLVIGGEHYLGGGYDLRLRFIRKELVNVIEDLGVFNDQGSEVYVVANPGSDLICGVSASAGNPCQIPERRYDAVEIGVSKTYGSAFFDANYTWSRLFGNYSGLASSDEFGRVDPNTTRTFDLPFEGFTANGAPNNGRLASDRPHVFKALGGYSYKWNAEHRTDVSAFTTVQSGTPLTTIYSLYGLNTSILFGRGDLGRTDIFSETDLRIGHSFGIGSDKRYRVNVFAEMLNLFDEQNELSRQTSISSTNFTAMILTSAGCTTCSGQFEVINTIFRQGGIEQYVLNYLNAQGTSGSGFRNDYNQPNLFQAPRSVRFGVRLRF